MHPPPLLDKVSKLLINIEVESVLKTGGSW